MKYSIRTLLSFTFGFLWLNIYSQDTQNDSTELFNKFNFYKDTLFIRTRFQECGEFGGHEELSKIYLKGDIFYLTYYKYSADCDKLNENQGSPPQTLIKTINKKLAAKDIPLIHKYAHELIEAKFRQPMIMHSGYIFEFKTTDRDIEIYVYTWGNKTIDEYSSFMKALLE